jgi:hypothetical protein
MEMISGAASFAPALWGLRCFRQGEPLLEGGGHHQKDEQHNEHVDQLLKGAVQIAEELVK